MSSLLQWFQFDVGEGAFYAVFGLIFVILGISLLVVIFTVLGLVMKKVQSKSHAPKEKMAETTVKEEDVGLKPEVVAAITAALTAYYEQENVKCDFVVRRIKKVR